MSAKKYTLPFSKIGKSDISIVGGKGANLGEMYNHGFPVPNGFVITAGAYFEFLEKTSLIAKISQSLKNLDSNNTVKLQQASKNIMQAITRAKIPSEISQEILTAYAQLGPQMKTKVAVRSSATAEDLPDASFAGQQETYLDVIGPKDLLKYVRLCWASLFESRAIFYRDQNGYSHFKVGIAVPIQKMVNSDNSGIMFTVDPMTGNKNHLVIEAAFGLGQPVVSGELVPDFYIVKKSDNIIFTKNISSQQWQLVANRKVKVSKNYQNVQKISDKFILDLAKIGIELEDHYHHPQDVEWAIENNTLYIVQTRPITTLKEKVNEIRQIPTEIKYFLSGTGASPGVATGKVTQVKNKAQISKVKAGNILVAVMTDPDYVPAMKKASAIVTDVGGRTSHAAIVSRELSIPCIVGTIKATKLMKNGQTFTVDGQSGMVYKGDITNEANVVEKSAKYLSDIKTVTKIYVNLAEPERAADIARLDVDGIGLLRAEFIIAQIGIHPKELIARGRSQYFIDRLTNGIKAFGDTFLGRPVIYRATDFKTNEYKNLIGGEKYEPHEPNPMLGYRGCFRYIDDEDVFALEIEALKRVRKTCPNVHLMIPFIHSVEELRKVKKILSRHGLRRSKSFKLFMMVELPVNVILLDDFIDEGIDGISIGSNDLTMTMLGVDRDNNKVASAYDELSPAMLWAYEKIITTAMRRGIHCSFCGQAPSFYPDLTRKLVHWGITAVSVNPDAVDVTKSIIVKAEQDLLHNHGHH